MLVCVVEMRAAPGRREEFVALCKEGVPRAIAAGCLHAEVLSDCEDKDVCVVIERWPSEEAFRAFSGAEWADDVLMARYRELALGTPLLKRLAPVA